MRNTFKRVLSFILALTMVLGLGVNAFALPSNKVDVPVYVGINDEFGTIVDKTCEGVEKGANIIQTLKDAGFTGDKFKNVIYLEELEGYNWNGKYYNDENCTDEDEIEDTDGVGSKTKVYINFVDYCIVNFYVGSKLHATKRLEKGTDGKFLLEYSVLPETEGIKVNGFDCIGWLGGLNGALIGTDGLFIPGTETSFDVYAAGATTKKFVVTFDANGGALKNAAEAQREVVEGQPVGTLPEVNDREGYRFRGWNANGESGFWNETVVVDKNYTLFARWEAIEYWTINFNPNGGVFANPEDATKKVEKGTAIGEMPTPTRAGYAFAGWYDNINTPNEFKIEKEQVIVNGNHTYTAKWEAGKYNVIFDNCAEITGEAPVSVAVTNGETINAGYFGHFDATGYDFAGWCSDEARTTLAPIPTGKWNLTGDVTYYAKYTPKPYTVAMKGEPEGNTDIAKVKEFENATVKYGEKLSLAEFDAILDNRPISYFKVVSNGEVLGTFAADTTEIEWKYDIVNPVVWAVYSDTKQFTVTFNDDLGGFMYSELYDNNTNVNFPEIPEKPGFTGAWTVKATGATFSGAYTITKDEVFQIKYTAKTYQAQFFSNGTFVKGTNAVTYGMRISMILPSLADIKAVTSADMPGYNFLGWELEGKTYAVNCTDTWQFDEDDLKIFNAVWEPAEYTVTLDANGGRFADGTTTKQFQIKTGESFSGKLETPAKDNGNTFLIWRLDSNNVENLENKVFDFAKNITLKAIYTDTENDTIIDVKVINTWNDEVVYDSKLDAYCHSGSNYVGVNGGYANSINDLLKYNKVIGNTFTAAKAAAPTYGYTAGIATSPDGEAKDISAYLGKEVTEDTIFYIVYDGKAVYEVNIPNDTKVYTIATYNVRYGQKLGDAVPAIALGDDLTYYDEVKILPATDAGLTFNGWYEKPYTGNKIGVVVNNPEMQAEVVAKANRTPFEGNGVVAEYVAYTNTKDIDAKLDAKGGVFENGLGENIVKIPYGEDVGKYILSIKPTKVGYNFVGWETFGILKMPNKETTFEAVWQQKSIKVTFVDADKVGIPGYSDWVVYYDNDITSLPTPAQAKAPVGQEFDGWVYVDANSNEMPIVANAKWAIDAATAVITPKFEYIDYTITFDAEDGKFTDGTSKKVFDKAHYGDNVLGLLEETPVREGYNFKGWKADGAYVQDNAIVTTNVVLKADYQEKTVKINFYDPMAVKPTVAIGVGSVTYGKTLMEATRTWDQARNNLNGHTGYDFKVWVDEAENEYENDTPIKEDDEILNLTATYTPKTYTLTFDAQGGKWDDNGFITRSVTFNAPVGELPEAHLTKDGYKFDKWSTYEGVVVTAGTHWDYAGNGTIYARWVPNTYTITFKDGKTTVGTKEVTYDTAFGTLPFPEKTGYTFGGWWVNGVNNVETLLISDYYLSVNNNYRAENQNAYAKWIGNGYVIKFNANGGSYTGNNLDVQYGKDYKLPTEKISREGYDFLYWTSDEAGTTRVYDGVYNVLGDSTYYAKWQVKQYKVTFDPNNAAATTEKGVRNFDYGYKITQDDLFTIPGTYAGYKHTGRWFVEVTGGDKVFLPDFNYGITKDITIKAEWEPAEFTITYSTSLEGTTAPAPIKVKYLDDIKEDQLPELTKPGYKFLGWQYAGDGADIVADGNNKWQMTSDITIHAMWKQQTYLLKFKVDGELYKEYTLKYGEEIHFPTDDPTKTGYDFVAWYNGDQKLDKGTKYYYNYEVDKDFDAEFEAKKFTLGFDAAGGTLAEADKTREVTYDAAIGTLPTTTKTGYEFLGWYIGNDKLEDATEYRYISSKEAVAKWEEKVYTLTFIDSTKKVSEKPIKYNEGIVLPPEPTAPGKVFKGWFFDNNSNTPCIANEHYTYTQNKTAYAYWEVITYHINFDVNGGTWDPSITLPAVRDIHYGDSIGPLPVPTMVGHNFDGWFYGENKKLDASDTFTMTEDLTVIANWAPKTFVVTLDSNVDTGEIVYIKNPNGGEFQNSTFEVTYGDNVTKDEVPDTLWRVGHTFKGFNTKADGTGDYIKANKQWEILENTTYYAIWEKETYGIEFVLNRDNTDDPDNQFTKFLNRDYTPEAVQNSCETAGANFSEVNVTFNEKAANIPTPAQMVLKGYTFSGWLAKVKGVEGETELSKNLYNEDWQLDGGISVPTKDKVTLTAIWKANKYTVGYDVVGNLAGKYTEADFVPAVGFDTFDVIFDTEITDDMVEPHPTKVGYIFDGWFIGNHEVEAGELWTWDETDFDGEMLLEAHWIPEKYTITFVEDGDNYGRGINEGHVTDPKFNHNIAELPITYDAPVTLPTIPAVTGYDSVVWFDQQGTTRYESTNAWKFDLTENEGDGTATFYAHWTAHKWTVTFSVATGDGIEAHKKAERIGEIVGDHANVTATFDTKITAAQLPDLTLSGYNFLGWYKGDTKVEAGQYWKFDENTTLEAKWEPKTYPAAVAGLTFEFNQFGNIPVASKGQVQFTAPTNFTVTYDKKFAANTIAPTCKGYNFLGWKLGQVLYTADGNTYFEAALETIVGDALKVKFVAVWAPKTYTVTINANGGVLVGGTTPKVNAKYAENLGFTATKTGYTLDGFYCGNIKVYDRAGRWVAPVTFDPAGNNATGAFIVVAKWIANSYIVTFNPGYGSVYPESMTVVYDQPYGDLPTPSYGSYRFLYWVDQNNTIVKADSIYKFAGNSTLYARYKGSSSVTLDYRNMAGLDVVLGGTEEIFLGEVEAVEQLVVETPAEEAVVETPAEEAVVETPAEEAVVETPAEEVVETPTEEATEETTEVVIENKTSAAADPVIVTEEVLIKAAETGEVVIENKTSAAADPIVATEEVLIKAAETGEVIVIKGDEDEEPKAVRVISINADKGEVELEEVTEINPDTGAPVSANIAPAMFALLAAAAFAFGKRK